MRDHKKIKYCETCNNFNHQKANCDLGIPTNKIKGKDGETYHSVTNCRKYEVESFLFMED